MPSSAEFEKAPENTVKRNTHRALYDKETVMNIFKAVPVVHASFVSTDGLPQCMPMMGTIEEADDGEVYVYLHGSAMSRFIRTNKEGGTNIAITATSYDGFIFGLTPFSHSAQFRSAVLHGTVFPFSTTSHDATESEKLHAMRLLINFVAEGRWEQTRAPSSAELKATGVIRVRIDSASAKVYGGDTGTQIAGDLTNEDLTSKIWTGVIPIRQIALAPEPWGMNKVTGAAIPDNIANFSQHFERKALKSLPPKTRTA